MSSKLQGVERVFDVAFEQRRRRPQGTMLASRSGDDWVELSTSEVLERVDGVSAGLLAMGVKSGDRIGLLSSNRPEWSFVDLGAQQIGAVTVPLYPKMSVDNYGHILGQTEPAVLFVENAELRKKVRPAAEEVLDPERVLLFDEAADTASWTDARTEADAEAIERIAAIRGGICSDQLATIIYTSGTTGRPKGVELTQRNLVANLEGCMPLLPIDENDRALSFLPLNHVFERMLNYLYMARGVSIYYARSVDTVGEDLRDVAPQIFTTVPRLLEKVWERIEARGRELEGFRGRIFDWSVALADEFELAGKGPLYALQLWLARRLVFRRWRDGLGGEVVAVISGGAALNPRLARRFTAAGIDILEGYGLTETSPVLAVNRYERSERRFGSVGKPLHNVRIEIADDGEILCKGPNVTSGYYQDPEATAELFDEQGWLRTGDLGRIDDDGFLFIEDRKKSVFKTSGGKYVAPSPVETRLEESPLVGHAMLVGDDRKMVTALIQPAFDNLEDWCGRKGLDPGGREQMIELSEVRAEYERIVDETNENLDHTARIKRFELVPDSWSAESGELTPTMKLRREVILERYEERVERMYAD